MQNMKLEKKGRYTYIVVGGKSIRCASAKAGRELLDSLKSAQRTATAYKPGEAPTYATMPWFNWSHGYGVPPKDYGHECDHYLDDSGPEIMVKDDAGNWVQVTGLASSKPVREKPPTPPVEAARNLVTALEQESARLKELGEARTVWTIKNLGLSDKEIDDLRDHPEREPLGFPAAGGWTPIKPWEPWKEWCCYEELGPINSEVDGETQMRMSIDNTRRVLRYDEVRKIIESTPLKGYSLVLTRGWYRTAYMDRIERVVGMGNTAVPTASTYIQQTQALCAFPGIWFDLDCAGMVWQPAGGHVEIGLLVVEKFSGHKYKETPRFYPNSGQRPGRPADDWPRQWEGSGLIVL